MIKSLKKFIKVETSSTYLLFATTILAIALANSPCQVEYNNLINAKIFNLHFLSCINEGLMTIFFLVVGMEIKYEIIKGSLNSFSKAILPAIAALGGVIAPALIYLICNRHDVNLWRGWGIPIATDIAFSLGVLSLAGSRIPVALKTFLMALAIFDDLVAILIIAIFYTDNLSCLFLGLALICMITLLILNLVKMSHMAPYFIVGILLWFCLVKSGVHATLAGVALAFAIPLSGHKIKDALHPWVAWGILPLFAFANAGVSFFHLSAANLQISIILGILLGLFFGKQLGVFTACWFAVKLKIAKLPDHVSWLDLYAVAILCGIGFTISLFIGALAFTNYTGSYLSSVKIGVLAGSLLSGVIGYLMLRRQKR